MSASVKVDSAACAVTMTGIVKNAEIARQAQVLVKRIKASSGSTTGWFRGIRCARMFVPKLHA